MSPRVAGQGDSGNSPANIKKLSIGWMMAFLFVVSFVGLFSIVPLRKVTFLIYLLISQNICFYYEIKHIFFTFKKYGSIIKQLLLFPDNDLEIQVNIP